MALTFAVVAVRRWRERRARSAAGAAVGGVTLAGILAVAGCFLVGCCGSPMLVVWMNVFGAAFLPFAKPLMAGVSALTIGLAWWWMVRRDRSGACAPSCGDASAPGKPT